jgi:hypothetical protein
MPSQIAEQFLSARGSIGSLKEPMSRLCAVLKTFVKIGVGIGRTGTEGRFLRKGHENGPCINDSDTRETEQHRVELCKEWI